MKIVVIGASGRTGLQVLKHLDGSRHEVTAFVRNPAKLPNLNLRLAIVAGDVRDAAAMEKAVLGQDAVIATIGANTFKIDDTQESFMRNLVRAMNKEGIKRVVNLSAMAAGDSLEGTAFFMRRIMMPFLLHNTYDDKNKGEVYLFNSDLDYINVRPGRLNDGPAVGGVKAALTYSGLNDRTMSREDLAIFMIAQLERQEWVRKSVLIGH